MFKRLLAILSLTACSAGPVQDSPPVAPQKPIPAEPAPVRWELDVEQAAVRASAERKAMLLYFYNDYCEYCSTMEHEGFTDVRIRPLMNRFVSVRIDTMESEFAKEVGVKMVPAIVVVVATPSGGEPVGASVGYMNAEQLLSFLVLVGRRIERGPDKTAQLSWARPWGTVFHPTHKMMVW